jgi:hypothetical protein
MVSFYDENMPPFLLSSHNVVSYMVRVHLVVYTIL